MKELPVELRDNDLRLVEPEQCWDSGHDSGLHMKAEDYSLEADRRMKAGDCSLAVVVCRLEANRGSSVDRREMDSVHTREVGLDCYAESTQEEDFRIVADCSWDKAASLALAHC